MCFKRGLGRREQWLGYRLDDLVADSSWGKRFLSSPKHSNIILNIGSNFHSLALL